MSQFPSNSPYDYHAQNRAAMSNVSAMLQSNAAFLQTGFSPNSTYSGGPQQFGAANMFGQFAGVADSVFGQGSGQILNMAAPFLSSPSMAGLLGPIPGMISAMQGSMPIGGGGDLGAFAYGQLQSRLGKAVPSTVALPNNFGSQRQVDIYNEQQSQFSAFTGKQHDPSKDLASFNKALGTADSAYGMGVQLGNIRSMATNSRFKDVFTLYEASTGQKINDSSLDELIDLSSQGTTESAAKAKELLANDKALNDRAQAVIKNASRAAGLANFTMDMSKYMPMLAPLLGGEGAAAGLMDGLMGAMGLDKNPALFTAAGVQSLSMMGALGTAGAGTDANGKPVFAADRIIGGLTKNLDDTTGTYAGMQRMGARGAGQLMSELAKSGMLTSGGVDTFGSIKPEDVKKMEQAIAMQLEGFSEVAAVGKRLGVQVAEITASMQRTYGGRFGQELSNEAGKIYGQLQADFVGPQNDDTRAFMQAEAQRKAGVNMMQTVEKAVQLGKYAGLDAKGSLAVMETAGQLAEGLGLGGSAAVSMASGALARVGLSRGMGRAMTVEQAMVQQQDMMFKASNNSSVKAYSALKLAIQDGFLKDDPQASALLAAFEKGEDISFEAASNLIGATGANIYTYTSQTGIAAGMSVKGVADQIGVFSSTNENVSVTGSVKRAMQAMGVNADELTAKLTGSGSAKLAAAFGIEEAEAKGMDFQQFAVKFNALGSQAARSALLADLGVSREERGAIMSNLGDRIDQFHLASDKGSNKTAAVIMAEEQQRRQYGITTAEAAATAVAENQATLNNIFKVNKLGTQSSLGTALTSIRDRKIAVRVKDGATQAEAEKAVDSEMFSPAEFVEALSGGSSTEMNAAITQAKDLATAELATATQSGDKKGMLVAQKKVDDLKNLELIRTADPEERKKLAKKYLDEDEERSSAVTESQAKAKEAAAKEKAAAEVDQSVVLTSKNTAAILVALQSLVEPLLAAALAQVALNEKAST